MTTASLLGGDESEHFMDFSKDKALDMIMGFNPEHRSDLFLLAEELAAMETNVRAELKQAVAWIEKYSVQPQQGSKKSGRGPDRAPRKRHARQVGSVTAGEA